MFSLIANLPLCSICTMIILTLCVTGLGLLSSSSSRTRAKWLSCQIGCPSLLSLDNYVRYILENDSHISNIHHRFIFKAEFLLTSSTNETQAGKKVMKAKQLARTDMQPKPHMISSWRTPSIHQKRMVSFSVNVELTVI